MMAVRQSVWQRKEERRARESAYEGGKVREGIMRRMKRVSA